MKKITKVVETNWWFLKPLHDEPEHFFIRKEKEGGIDWFIGYEDGYGLIHNIRYTDDWTTESLEEEFQMEINK